VTGCNGASTHIREFANALAAKGAEVKILAARADAESSRASLACELIDVDTDPVLRRLRQRTAHMAGAASAIGTQAAELHNLLLNQTVLEHLDALHHRWPIDLVFERYSLWSIAGFQFARRRRIPFFLEVNAPLTAQQEEHRTLYNPATAKAVEHTLLSSADRVIVPSRGLADYVSQHGCPPDRVRQIPCGVSRELFGSPRSPESIAEQRDVFTVGFLGSLKPWHGVDILLETFRKLRERSRAYRLLVVGDGPLRTRVEEYGREPGASGCVTVTGEVSHADVPRYLARMDAGLATYPPMPLFYFSPLKIFEYAAAGVPIAASASGQIGEILEHRGNGLLHQPGNVDEIVQHVEELRARPILRVRFARRARRTVLKGYTWDRQAGRLLGFAENVWRRYAASRAGHPGAPSADPSETPSR
jgi:glycosyltransferase involved in cell wall biosynthesis